MSKWISVKERLPEESGQYLTLSSSGIYAVLNYSAKYRAFNAWDCQPKKALAYSLEVAHWMPLPEPPKEEGGRRNRMRANYPQYIHDPFAHSRYANCKLCIYRKGCGEKSHKAKFDVCDKYRPERKAVK